MVPAPNRASITLAIPLGPGIPDANTPDCRNSSRSHAFGPSLRGAGNLEAGVSPDTDRARRLDRAFLRTSDAKVVECGDFCG